MGIEPPALNYHRNSQIRLGAYIQRLDGLMS